MAKYNDKPFHQAFRKVVMETIYHEDPVTNKLIQVKRLELLARQLYDNAMAGDTVALKEAADRLDGKAHQTTEAHITTERMVVQAPDVAKDAEEWIKAHEPKVH